MLGRDRTEAGQPLNYLRQIFLAGWAGTDDVLVSGMLERERERESVETNNVQIFLFRNSLKLAENIISNILQKCNCVIKNVLYIQYTSL